MNIFIDDVDYWTQLDKGVPPNLFKTIEAN
jgi:hypothetical protein